MNRLSTFLRFVLGTVLLCSLVLGEVDTASAALRCYVKQDAGGLNNGSSWANAYTSLQSALGTSPCTQIWVAGGTYKPTSGTDRSVSFRLKNGVSLYGGFAGTETQLSQRDPAANATILSGDIGANGDTADNSYHVVVGSGTNGTAVLNGFAIAGGNANADTRTGKYGGGLYNITASPSLSNLIFGGNSAEEEGGGMYNSGGAAKLTNVMFRDNFAGMHGGGMQNQHSSPFLRKVIFDDNYAVLGGGGMYNVSQSSPNLRDTVFSDNTATYGGGMINIESTPTLVNVTFSGNVGYNWLFESGAGGGMYNDNSNPILTNVSFSHNSAASTRGGGMYNANGSSPSLMNVTFSGNFAGSGGGMYNASSYPVIKNSILYGDTGGEILNDVSSSAIVRYSIVQGGYPGAGNLNVDPLLGPLQNNGGFTQTMALGPGSAAIDKGTNTGCPLKDQRGVARPQDGDRNGTATCDMGATEARLFVKAFQSIGTQDGWVLESTENSGVGSTAPGDLNASSETITLGDDAADRQGISILSFNTARLPDRAVIVSVVLKFRYGGMRGTNPFTTHGNILVDVRTGTFSNNAVLQPQDFEAPASRNMGITIRNTPVNAWYSGRMAAGDLTYINKLGLTQFRLRFEKDDDDDQAYDYLKFSSGNCLTTLYRPKLIIKYYLP